MTTEKSNFEDVLVECLEHGRIVANIYAYLHIRGESTACEIADELNKTEGAVRPGLSELNRLGYLQKRNPVGAVKHYSVVVCRE